MSDLDQYRTNLNRKSLPCWNRPILPSRYQPHREIPISYPACEIPSINDRQASSVAPLYKILIAPPASVVDPDMAFGLNSNPRAPNNDYTIENSPQDLDSKEDLVSATPTPPTLPVRTVTKPNLTVPDTTTADAKPDKTSSARPRKRRTCHGAGDGDEDGRPKPSRKQIFACPYFRNDPIRHMPCVKLALTRIKDVKQHLNRVHDRLPCPDCVDTCAATPDEEVATRPGGACQEQRSNVVAALDRISRTQREQLSRRLNPKLSCENQWFQLWEILFPEAKPPATPYLSAPIEEIVGVMKGYWERHSSRIISSAREDDPPEDTAVADSLLTTEDGRPTPRDQVTSWIRATVDSFFAKFVQESKSKRTLKPSSHHPLDDEGEPCGHEREPISEEEQSVSIGPEEPWPLEELDPGGYDTYSESFQDWNLGLHFNAELEKRCLKETLTSAPQKINEDILALIQEKSDGLCNR